MEKELSIIIPTYNDSIEKIKITLDSISKQTEYDLSKVEVIIIDDGSNNNLINWNELIKLYDLLNIIYIKNNENKGPGVARQIAIDNSTANFVFFLDCGDTFYDVLVLKDFDENKSVDTDIVAMKLFDEETGDKRRGYQFNNSYIFGIFINRQFLIDNNIRFSDYLRWEEDAYFEQLLRFYNPKVNYIHNIGYTYKNDKNSITRKNNHEYSNDGKGFSAMVVKSILICDFYKSNNNLYLMIDEAMSILASCYRRFYDDIYVKQRITERESKIFELLKLLVNKIGLKTDSEEFLQFFIKEVYKRNFTSVRQNGTSVPYDKITDFYSLINNYENMHGDYNIEGTNIKLSDLEKFSCENSKKY